MSEFRAAAAPLAEAVWGALRRAGERGLIVSRAAERADASDPHVRRLMRRWREAGFADYIEPETDARDDSGRYVIADDAPERAPILTLDGEAFDREGYMSASEFAAARRKLGVNLREFGKMLGHKGVPVNLSREMRRYETGKRPIGEQLAAKVRKLVKRGAR